MGLVISNQSSTSSSTGMLTPLGVGGAAGITIIGTSVSSRTMAISSKPSRFVNAPFDEAPADASAGERSINRQRAHFHQIGPDDRQCGAANDISVDFVNGEIAQRLVELRVTLKQHLPQLGVAVDDLLN